MRLGVLGNCDTGGISHALKAFLPSQTVTPLVLPAVAERADWASKLGAEFDALLVNSSVLAAQQSLLSNAGVQVVAYPQIYFSAFHPDCCYVENRATKSLIAPAYNSALCMACFVRGIPAETAVTLFNRDVFEELGYFDAWDENVARMQKQFSENGMDFRPFYLRVKRTGAFMHSMNHPKVGTIVALARLIALKLGADPDMASRDIYLPDTLAGLNWPVYPEIAENYGFRGQYWWVVDGRVLDLAQFVEHSYRRYVELGLTKATAHFGLPSFHAKVDGMLQARGIA